MENNEIDSALKYALGGNCILFLGAGIGGEVKNVLKNNLPKGQELANILLADLGRTERDMPLSKVAQFYRKKKGAYELRKLLEKNLNVVDCSPKLNDLLSMPWKRIYTTNYDNTLSLCRNRYKNFSYSDRPKAINIGDHVYLNGHLGTATLDNLDSDLVLTDWSYTSSSFSGSNWENFFRQDISTSKSILFIGYSMSDLDITRVLIANDEMKSKIVIVAAEGTNDIDAEVLSSYGKLYTTGLDFVYARKKQISKNFEIPEDIFLYSSLNKIDISIEDKTDITIADYIYEQLVYGKLDRDIVLSSNKEIDVLIRRSSIAKISTDLLNGNLIDINLVGGIGSGKTFTGIDICKILLENGYSAYVVRSRRDLQNELAEAAKEDKVVFFFDSYARYMPDIEFFAKIRRPTHICIYAERTSTNEILEPKIKKNITGDLTTIDLDRLSFDDIINFDALLNFSGLWKEFSGWRSSQRVSFVQSTLSSSLSSLLIRAVRSEDVIQKINTEIKSVLNDEPVALFFTAALISNTLQYDFWISDWQTFFKTRNISRGLELHRESLSHFVNITASSITARAGLVSQEMLRSIISPALKIDAMEALYKGAIEHSYNDTDLRELVVDLMMYSKIEPLFRDDEDAEKLTYLKKYYQKIRIWGDTQDRSDYWLQYGIFLSIHGNLQLSDDLNQCKLAFENAYKREKSKSNPNLRRIDNYYSRFQLQMSILSTAPNEAFNLFWDGSMKLIKQIFDEETRHYPFKVGKLYSDVAALHFRNWSDEQKDRFLARCREMISYAEERSLKINQKDVIFMLGEMNKLVEKLTAKS